MFGMGILYTILSPVILALFLAFLIYSFVNYLVCEGIYLGGFFLGKKFVAETELDKKFAKIKEEKKQASAHEENVVAEGGDLNV
jgi:hypothetical protein